MGQHIDLEMIEGIVFSKVNLANAVGGTLMVVVVSFSDFLQEYTAVVVAVGSTVLALYNIVRFVRLLANKENED